MASLREKLFSFFVIYSGIGCTTLNKSSGNDQFWWHLALGGQSHVKPEFGYEFERFGVNCQLDSKVVVVRKIRNMGSRYLSCRINGKIVRIIVSCKRKKEDEKHLLVMQDDETKALGMIQLACRRLANPS